MLLNVTDTIDVILAAAPATTQPTWVASYVDLDDTTWGMVGADNSTGATNGTTAVTMVAAVGSAKRRKVQRVSVYNGDTLPVIVSVRVQDGATRILTSLSLAVGCTLSLTERGEWQISPESPPAVVTIGSNLHLSGAGGLNADYCAGHIAGTANTTGAPSANVLRAIPFVAPPRGGTIGRLAINVTTLLAGNARIGIYHSTSEANLYPAALRHDSGDLSTTTTGVKSSTPNLVLIPGRLYWAVHVGSVAATLRCLAVASCASILGFDAALGTAAQVGISVAHTFGALPANFPAGGAVITAVPIPAIHYRLS